MRANLHAGGCGEPIQLSREVSKLAVDTAKALNVDICGIDILDGPLGPKVIEANISPGLQGLNETSTLDLPDEIAKFLFRKTQEAVSDSTRSGAVSDSTRSGAADVLRDISIDTKSSATQQIVTSLHFRGERILLPELVTKMTDFSDQKEYTFKARKGKLEIEEIDF